MKLALLATGLVSAGVVLAVYVTRDLVVWRGRIL